MKNIWNESKQNQDFSLHASVDRWTDCMKGSCDFQGPAFLLVVKILPTYYVGCPGFLLIIIATERCIERGLFLVW